MNRDEVDRLRRATPGCVERVHLNSSGASLPSTDVVDAVIDHLRREAEIGPYEAAEERAGEQVAFAGAVAALIGAEAEEITYCDAATRAWNLIVYGLALGPGDKILASAVDFGGSLLALRHLADRTGAELIVGPGADDGTIDLDALAEDDLVGLRLIAVSHVAAHSGAVNPVVELGRLAREHGAVYLLDASQSVGCIPVDVATIGCDALVAPGRKWLRGPRGTAFAYVSRVLLAQLDPPTIDLLAAAYRIGDGPGREATIELRSDHRRLEVWERNVAGTIGLGVAVSSLLEIGVDRVADRVVALSRRAVEGLAAIDRVRVWSRPAASGVVGFSLPGIDASAIHAACSARGINVSVMTSRAAPHDFLRRGEDALVRVGAHAFNLESEIDLLLETVAAAAATGARTA